jgi:hypothetical protein
MRPFEILLLLGTLVVSARALGIDGPRLFLEGIARDGSTAL